MLRISNLVHLRDTASYCRLIQSYYEPVASADFGFRCKHLNPHLYSVLKERFLYIDNIDFTFFRLVPRRLILFLFAQEKYPK